MKQSRRICVNIDLDDLRFYRGIHALPQIQDTPIVFERAVPRFLNLCESVGIRATLFVITEDLKWPEAVAAMREAVARGHEVASHSHTHRYGISRLGPDEITRELTMSRDAIEHTLGLKVQGFRAPGYNLTDGLLGVLKDLGFVYDSSILPSPAYWTARATIIGLMAVTGRKSSSITGRWRDFFRSRDPFVWQRGAGAGLAELPMTACGPARLPLIGTTLAHDGMMSRHLVGCAKGLDWVNVEFHGLDFLDIEKDCFEHELAVEPALKTPLSARLESYRRALEGLVQGRKTATLAEIALDITTVGSLRQTAE